MQFHTAPLAYQGPDRFDVSLRTNLHLAWDQKPAPGLVFAPSPYLLWPTLKARRAYRGKLPEPVWVRYQVQYAAEMRWSYQRHTKLWLSLLRKEHVVLCCVCDDHTQCHRVLLADMLVKAGAKLGMNVTYLGELPKPVGGWKSTKIDYDSDR
jgi:hypothetical protein